MTAKFWLYNKKENSTARPSANTGTDLEIKLKDRVDVDNPVILCQTNVMNYNYMQFDGSYYFIRRKTYVANSLFEIEAERDPLATYKSEIMASTQYITRTNVSGLINNEIFDEKYPLTIEPHSASTPSPSDIFSWTNPTYLLTVKGRGGSQIIKTNKGSIDLLGNLIYSKTQKNIWDLIGTNTDFPNDFQKTYLDPFSYIVDCRLIPVPFVPGGVTYIDLGPMRFNDDACAFQDVTNNVQIMGDSVTLNYGFLSDVSGNYRYLYSNKSRSVSVYLPGVGNVSLDVERCVNNVTHEPSTSVTVEYKIDNKGHVAYKVQSGVDIQYASADISIPHALYSNIANIGGVVSSASRVIGATAGGVAVGGLVGGFLAGSVSAISSATPLYKTASLGSDGSRASIVIQPRIVLYETQYRATEQAPAVFGYPSCKYATLNTNGYYLIDTPVVSFGDDLIVKNAIADYMRRGFYVE